MRKIVLAVLCITLLTSSFMATVYSDGREISVLVNGTKLEFDVPPQTINDRTMVPLRAIFEALGATVEWFDEASTAIATKDYTVIQIKTGSTILIKNSGMVTLDVPPQLVDDRVLVPVRAIAESFDSVVDWDEESTTVSVTYTEPIYNENVVEEDVPVGSEPYVLKGKLTLPKNAEQPVPAVVLVHGSGSTDMDETIMNNKPFRDIADYFSSNGIAVLRYDKRPYTYGAQMLADGLITVENEVIEDAVSATNILKADSRIDPKKVFIIGHSFGGMLAPRIDAEGGDYAGIVIMAGSPRPLQQIMLDQMYALLPNVPDDQKETAKKQVDDIAALFKSVETMSDEQAKATPMMGGTTGYYYKEMDKHPVEGYLETMTKPVLIMQGGKDFQVYADKDFAEYKRIADGKNNIELKLYDSLNHLFMPSITGNASEYAFSLRVNNDPLKDIADWIKQFVPKN